MAGERGRLSAAAIPGDFGSFPMAAGVGGHYGTSAAEQTRVREGQCLLSLPFLSAPVGAPRKDLKSVLKIGGDLPHTLTLADAEGAAGGAVAAAHAVLGVFLQGAVVLRRHSVSGSGQIIVFVHIF